MARSITVVVTLIGEHMKSAGVELRTSTKTWSKSEPGNVDAVFRTKSGSYRVFGTSTELLKPGGGARVGRLAELNPDTVADKATGQGISDDVGSAVMWKVDGISQE